VTSSPATEAVAGRSGKRRQHAADEVESPDGNESRRIRRDEKTRGGEGGGKHVEMPEEPQKDAAVIFDDPVAFVEEDNDWAQAQSNSQAHNNSINKCRSVKYFAPSLQLGMQPCDPQSMQVLLVNQEQRNYHANWKSLVESGGVEEHGKITYKGRGGLFVPKGERLCIREVLDMPEALEYGLHSAAPARGAIVKVRFDVGKKTEKIKWLMGKLTDFDSKTCEWGIKLDKCYSVDGENGECQGCEECVYHLEPGTESW
jgi:hypothetical protein